MKKISMNLKGLGLSFIDRAMIKYLPVPYFVFIFILLIVLILGVK